MRALNTHMPLETLTQFYQRTTGFSEHSLPDTLPFVTDTTLDRKIAPDGRCKPFAGDTVLFRLLEDDKARLSAIQEILYSHCPTMLAQRLDRDTFHITLHDLTAGLPEEQLLPQMNRNQAAVEPLLQSLVAPDTSDTSDAPDTQPASVPNGQQPFVLRSTYLFNMMNRSVVLGFAPVDELTCQRLMQLYQQFQNVVRLSYPLTPHCTLAYYRPGSYSDVTGLQTAIQTVRAMPELRLTLFPQQLVYCRFQDMSDFR